MKFFLSSITAIALATGAASAASAAPFDGPFVGVQGGWSQNDVDGAAGIDRSSDTASIGGYAGYDLRLGPNLVLGAEAGLHYGLNDDMAQNVGAARVALDPRRSIDLSARAGVLAGEDTLVYARGGYTNARVRTTVTDALGTRSGSQNRDGWLVGGGLEHALSESVSARAEYRYSDLGEGDGGFDRHQALFGISYRF